MKELLDYLAKAKAVVQRNPVLLVFFVIQMIMQSHVAGQLLQLNGLLAEWVMAIALASAHIIPAYAVYAVGDGSGLARVPGLKSKVTFLLLGFLLASVFALTFTYCVLGIACQPFLPLVVNPSIQAAGAAGLAASVVGSLVDVVAVAAIFAFGGLGDE